MKKSPTFLYLLGLQKISNQEFEMFQPKHIRSVSSSCDKCPVTMISWYQANSYCKNINARLPSEAEWEKAARGPTGYRYSFGKISDQILPEIVPYYLNNCAFFQMNIKQIDLEIKKPTGIISFHWGFGVLVFNIMISL